MRRRATLAAALLTATLTLPAHAATGTLQLPLTLTITPNPMGVFANNATIAVATAPGAECAAGVTYEDGRRAPSFPHILVKIADTRGKVTWTWHHKNQSQGTAIVMCIAGALSHAVGAHFGIAPRGSSAPTPVPPINTPLLPTATPTAPSTPTVVPPLNTPLLPTATPTASSTPTVVPTPAPFMPPPPTATAEPGTNPDAPGIRIAASNLHADSSGNVPPASGNKYMVVTVTIANNGTTPYQYNALDLSLQDLGDNSTHTADAPDSNIRGTGLRSGTLSPGQTVAGDLAFEVPLSETHFSLLWRAKPLGATVPVAFL